MKTSHLPGRILTLLVAMICCYLILPTLIILPISFTASNYITFPPEGFSLRWYQLFFSEGIWRSSAITSVLVAILTSVVATIIGTMAALALRGMTSRGARIAIWFILLPMIIPSIVTAVALYSTFARLGIVGTYLGVVTAHTIIALPFVVISVSAVMQKVDWKIIDAARSLGASPITAFRKITLPSILPGVVTGAGFAFLTSFDEVVVSLFVTGIETVTLPVQMWNGIRFEISPAVAAVSSIMLCFSVAFLILYTITQKIAAIRGQSL